MPSDAIQPLIAPSVMISACGLICLALYGRFATILERIRGMHQERLGLFDLTDDAHKILRIRFEGLEQQTQGMLRRAKIMQKAICSMLVCIGFMLASSLAIGAAVWLPSIRWAVVWLFVLGVASMMVGTAYALTELRLALKEVEFEHASLERLSDSYQSTETKS